MGNRKLNKRILLLYRSFSPSVNLCGYAQLERLSEEGFIDFRHRRMLDVHKEDLFWADIVVFVRGDGALDELMATACHRMGKYILYVLDDDLLNVPSEIGSGSYYAQKSVKRHIRKMLDYANCFASPSEKLICKYGGLCTNSFRIIEPSLYNMEKKKDWKDGRIHIGFAGSSDRSEDIDKLLSEALERIDKKYRNRISVEFFGVRPETAKKSGYITYPYTKSYYEYQKTMAKLNWHIGLAPMPDTEFHACKHYSKLVEYCGYGIVGVYSKVPPYEGVVEHGVTGLLCENTADDWEKAISELIEDESLRKRMEERCLEKAHGDFSIDNAAMKLKEELDKIGLPVSNGKSCTVNIDLAWIKQKGTMIWFIEKLKHFGWETPIVAVKKFADCYLKRGK